MDFLADGVLLDGKWTVTATLNLFLHFVGLQVFIERLGASTNSLKERYYVALSEYILA